MNETVRFNKNRSIVTSLVSLSKRTGGFSRVFNFLTVFPAQIRNFAQVCLLKIWSIESQWIPAFEILNDLLKSDAKTLLAIIRYPGVLAHGPKTFLRPNINVLKENGVPESNIATIVYHHPRIFFTKPDQFRETVEEVKRMGLEPRMFAFVAAVRVLRAMSKLTWKKKIDVYKKCGWSEERIVMAFRTNPFLMMLSENKIMGMMDYFVNVMGLESSFISERPGLLVYSLKKRVVPRGSVAQVLLSKGLVKASCLSILIGSRENVFLEKFVYRYQEEAPQLLKIYTDKLDFSRQLGNE
ncbi:putative Mitochondrial transcription termination factor family protein [Tripterygium wilfordii]|uniref:Putative Mitochondrial transcription termination factor family protein n=1 Tax=Tripterygium wilfordii TaxID=458696 RepID=A0A7J7E0T5_TRIWF|nr:putative Mitochondrial transcription termination factor family protein [Tripterygium wilfordii]